MISFVIVDLSCLWEEVSSVSSYIILNLGSLNISSFESRLIMPDFLFFFFFFSYIDFGKAFCVLRLKWNCFISLLFSWYFYDRYYYLRSNCHIWAELFQESLTGFFPSLFASFPTVSSTPSPNCTSVPQL